MTTHIVHADESAMDELMTAYAAVLDEVPNFVTDETADIPSRNGGAGRRYKYLNLATILKTIKPIFAKHGLHFFQRVTFAYNPADSSNVLQMGTVCTTIFTARTSLTIGEYPFVVTGDPQANGSAVTYARRYALYAVLGIFPDKDDDGATARDYYNAPQRQQGPSTISQQDAHRLKALAERNGLNLLQYANQVCGRQISRLREITKQEAARIEQSIIENGGNQNAA